MAMGQATLVPDVSEVVLDQLMAEGRSQLVMVLRPAGEGSVCPECQQASRRIHYRYRRRLNDLPWEGSDCATQHQHRRQLWHLSGSGLTYPLRS
jgi:transposase